ncbi:MAG TPA: hypothetical protein VNJ54_15160 [Plantibacter sp.]|uniref:hypothetical protein n=1 Tax=Plantibacter sp. TaxID=1871045 RepID=UPI002CB28178|nr:hypothetical protein [Plantibacter sp.]
MTRVQLVDEWAERLKATAMRDDDPQAWREAVNEATDLLIQRERARELRAGRGYRASMSFGQHVVLDPHGGIEMWCADETGAVQAASALNRERLAAKARLAS